MATRLPANSQNVSDIFTGELCFGQEAEVKKSFEERRKPDIYDPFRSDRFSLIEDSINKVSCLKGDFIRDDNRYGFTVKVFLYPKDGKALGNLTYVKDAKQPPFTINARFIQTEEGFIIHGFIEPKGGEGKEWFILFAEKLVG
jgi:hypothetical protein